MGDIADMTLDGMLCEGCGVYMGDECGYPRRRRSCQRDIRDADLLDACIDDDGHGLTCVICGGWRYGSATAEHLPGCKRAAAERVIARERE